MRKTEIESLDDLIAMEIAQFDAEAASDEQTFVEDFGIEYSAYEELLFGSKEHERDTHRWELDPASAEDYIERTRGWRMGTSTRWRHFGH